MMVDLSRAKWRKSSFSGSNGCVEVAFIDGRIAVRDSKDRRSPVLIFDRREWVAFIRATQNGEFEPPR
jgi:hypothetical protein